MKSVAGFDWNHWPESVEYAGYGGLGPERHQTPMEQGILRLGGFRGKTNGEDVLGRGDVVVLEEWRLRQVEGLVAKGPVSEVGESTAHRVPRLDNRGTQR